MVQDEGSGQSPEKLEAGSFRLVSAGSIWKLVHVAFRVLSLLVALALVLIDLQFVLGLFLWTRGVAENFRALALAPLFLILGELAATTPRLLVVALIVFRDVHAACGLLLVHIERFVPRRAQ
jgi:hypothetical protein